MTNCHFSNVSRTSLSFHFWRKGGVSKLLTRFVTRANAMLNGFPHESSTARCTSNSVASKLMKKLNHLPFSCLFLREVAFCADSA